ncbi:MAG: substrate-binding domain-containing protein [Pyrinomonadaceae bacterium]
MLKTGFLIVILLAVWTTSCVNQPQPQTNNGETVKPNNSSKVKIGLSMSTLKEERWVRDREAFEKRCRELSVECVITIADGKVDKQTNDVDNLLTQGVNVLVIIPQDATQAASMVEKAKAQNVPVISYDRLINSDKLDLYISHQIPVIGRKIAEYALQHVPKGNYVMVYGAPTDNNALVIKKAQLEVLQPAIERGDIKIVADQFATDWRPEEALKIVENALTQQNDNIQAVVASNDGTAGGSIAALEKKGLTGKVLVTGQDAEKAALQRIAEGKQTMTIYKPIVPLATGAVDAALKLANKEPLANATIFHNDKLNKDIPAILLEVIVVDKSNLMETVIKDGYVKYEDVYANVSSDQRPKQ